MQAAGRKAIVGHPVNISLSTLLRLPPEISAVFSAARYPEACAFAMVNGTPQLRFPSGPSLRHLLGRPLRSAAERWLETCRWVSVKENTEVYTQIGKSLELSWLLTYIALTFGHQIYPTSRVGFVSQYSKVVLQIKEHLRSSQTVAELGAWHESHGGLPRGIRNHGT